LDRQAVEFAPAQGAPGTRRRWSGQTAAPGHGGRFVKRVAVEEVCERSFIEKDETR